jgi:hypothetical protein
MSEIQIQSAILDYLILKKRFVVRLNNIPPVQNVGGKMVFRRMPKGSVLGLPDIMVLTDGGYAVFLEIKAPKGKQSENQKQFQRRCEEVGCEYYVIRSLEEVIEIGL